MFCASRVVLIEMSISAAIKAFGTEGAGWFIWCSSLIFWFIISCIALVGCSFRWYRTERDSVATDFLYLHLYVI